MIKNYVKIAFRNLLKHKLYSVINIFGLAVGIACCVLIALYVANEWSYDEFHSKSDRIYRAWVQETTPEGREILNTSTPVPLAGALEQNIPEVEHATYLYQFNNLVERPGSEQSFSESILAASPDFFRIFDFELLQGDPEIVFKTPSSVVLTPSIANRLFGDRNPIQQTLSIRLGNEFVDFSVTGIIEEPPSNSSLQYGILIPDSNLDALISEGPRNSWFNIFGPTYVLLKEGSDPAALETKLQSMMRGILGKGTYQRTQFKLGLQSLTDIHLNTAFPMSLASVSDPVYSYILTVIALLVLLIACVNFMTLSISRSTARAKEVGIRKAIGAQRQHLMYQFWGEALLMTLLALIFGVTLAELLLPFFNDLSATELDLQFSLQMVSAMGAATVLISLVAGSYPALILSGFRPVEVLKGRLNLSADKSLFRQFMVIAQFTVSIVLIITTIMISRQLNYVQDKELGYQTDQVVVLESGLSADPNIPLAQTIEEGKRQKEILQAKFDAIPGVGDISLSSFTPVQMGGWFRVGFQDRQGQSHTLHANIVDADFISTLGIKVIEGRSFLANNLADAQGAIVVNEALVDYFGWKNPIGKRLPGPEFIDHEVVGVVSNFHYESLHTPVAPLVMAINPEILFSGISNLNLNTAPTPRYSMRLQTADLPALMDRLREQWAQIAPGTPFNYTFVDDALDSQYRQEQRLSRIVTFGTVLAIVIACLGLFGLASLMIVRRTKEIGVRKVLGASAGNVVMLVNKEFTKLVAIAFVIALPIAWYGMELWLADFAYKIDMPAWVFLVAGLATLLVAWLTVSYQSLRAALINPVDSLHTE